MCPDDGPGAELVGSCAHGECRVVMDTYLYHIVASFFFLGSHVVQRAPCRHLFGSCLVGDVSLLPLRRVTIGNIVDVTIFGWRANLTKV